MNNPIESYTVDPSEILPLKQRVLFRAGLKRTGFSDPLKLREILNQMILRGLCLVQPCVQYCSVPIDLVPSQVIPQSFGRVQSMTFFASTLGSAIDQEIQDIADQNQILEATLIDSWASEALEQLNQKFDKHMIDDRPRTRRFSPGYGDIDLRLNGFIVSWLEFTNITAHPVSGILLPRKSTICMIGWSTGESSIP